MAGQNNGTERGGDRGVESSILELSEKIETLNGLLSDAGEQKISVTIENSDGAIQDLVSRVVEEVLIRVRQENILRVTNG
jgi:hypothetical protein